MLLHYRQGFFFPPWVLHKAISALETVAPGSYPIHAPSGQCKISQLFMSAIAL